jgi:hypothetical protein
VFNAWVSEIRNGVVLINPQRMMLIDHAHSRGFRRTSMSFPSSVPSAPISDMYSHRATSGRLSQESVSSDSG